MSVDPDCAACIRRTKWWYWTILFLWDALVYGVTTYLVFWKDAAGAWYLFAVLITINYHGHEE